MFDRETAVVIGLGKSGLAAAKALRANGARVIATDEKPREALSGAIAASENAGARFVSAGMLADALAGVTLAVLSPGVPPKSAVLQIVRDAKIPVVGEIELAYRLCAGPIIAVTGTKGKSTTTALICHMLRACGRDVRVGGNIGDPLIEQVAGAGPHTWCVAEVSSFQLETIVQFRPRISVVLNVAPDHLDRYRSMEEYTAAKFRIFENQANGDTAIINLDDPLLGALVPRLERRGLAIRGYRVRDVEALIGRAGIPLAGEHNVRNVAAALLAAAAAGCGLERAREATRSFTALPHRLQEVAQIDGILYVDDSKATNPQATIAALSSYERPIVLIAGGRAKGTDFRELGAAIRARAKALIVIGESAPVLAGLAGNIPGESASSMEDALARARRYAHSGDVVLLSPACASFDMFGSAEERGERFARAVRSLQETVHAQ